MEIKVPATKTQEHQWFVSGRQIVVFFSQVGNIFEQKSEFCSENPKQFSTFSVKRWCKVLGLGFWENTFHWEFCNETQWPLIALHNRYYSSMHKTKVRPFPSITDKHGMLLLFSIEQNSISVSYPDADQAPPPVRVLRWIPSERMKEWDRILRTRGVYVFFFFHNHSELVQKATHVEQINQKHRGVKLGPVFNFQSSRLFIPPRVLRAISQADRICAAIVNPSLSAQSSPV